MTKNSRPIAVSLMAVLLGFACATAPDSPTVVGSEAEATIRSNPLRSTSWIFRTVRGTTVALGSGRRQPSLVFQESDDQIRGFAGCNQIGASYFSEGNELTFGPITSTKMLCAGTPTMEVERNITRALETTARYQIEGGRLTLFNAKGVELALLESQQSP